MRKTTFWLAIIILLTARTASVMADPADLALQEEDLKTMRGELVQIRSSIRELDDDMDRVSKQAEGADKEKSNVILDHLQELRTLKTRQQSRDREVSDRINSRLISVVTVVSHDGPIDVYLAGTIRDNAATQANVLNQVIFEGIVEYQGVKMARFNDDSGAWVVPADRIVAMHLKRAPAMQPSTQPDVAAPATTQRAK